MDAMKFLFGATAALLFGAIFVSWQGSQKGSPEEFAEINRQLNELRDEVRKSRSQDPQPVAPKGPTVEEQLAEAQRKLAEAEAQALAANQANLDAQLQRDEQGLIAQRMLESGDDEKRRSRLISQALLVGRVSDYVDDPTYGGFITIDVLMREQVQVGSILGIRRNNTGILYQFKVSDVTEDGAIANPVTAIGAIKPERGDELIFPPLF